MGKRLTFIILSVFLCSVPLLSQGPGRIEGRSPAIDTPLQVTAKPAPGYTEEARRNRIEGTVVLRVVFLASGEIGKISPIKRLGSGLTEKAIEAAQKIKFKPAITNGVPVTVVKTITYGFRLN